MTILLEIIKIVVPSLLVFLTAFYILKSFVAREQKNRIHEFRMNNQEIITPIRLQAFERVTLLLERIAPESLLMRVNKKGMTCRDLHSELLTNIRNEFEHNLSQQVYISAKAWNAVKSAKTNTIKLINTSAEKVNPKVPSLELSKMILETVMEMDNTPSAIALDYLKKEVQTIF